MKWPDQSGRVREYAKMAVRSRLHRHNLDLVSNPFPVRVVTTLRWLQVTTVIDVGANIGQYASALRASGYHGRILSCEPLSDAFAHLSKRSASDSEWAVLHTAVGDEPGTTEINVAANSFSSSVLPMADAHRTAAPGSEFVGSQRVGVTTIEDLVRERAVDPASTFLKVDTQGYESRVLDGAGSLVGEFPAVQLELSMLPLYEGQELFGDLTTRMEKSGYALFSLEAGFADPRTGRMLQADGLFVRGDLVNRAADAGSSR
jgi:FkbM family methyltransferase